MNRNTRFIGKMAIVVELFLGIQAGVANAISLPASYEMALSMKLATEDQPYDYSSSSNIVMSSRSDKTLVNLVQNKDPSTRLEKNIVLALRIYDCKTGGAQLVVIDKSTKLGIKAVSKYFTLFDKKVQKITMRGALAEIRFSTAVEFLASGTNDFGDYGVNSGNIVIAGSAKFVTDTYPQPNQCPSSLSGYFLGNINITLQDPAQDAIILSGSKLSAKLLK